MKNLLNIFTILVLLIGCSVDPAQFNMEYDGFASEYKAKRENVRTSAQYDSLKTWAKETAIVIVDKYTQAGFKDTTLSKLANLMAYSEMSEEAISAFENSFKDQKTPDISFVSKYIDLLMKEDLKNEEIRNKANKALTEYKDILGDKWTSKTLYYGYYLAEKGLSKPAAGVFNQVIEANTSGNLTGQAVLEIAAITYEEAGIEKTLEYLKKQDTTFPDNKMIKDKIVQFRLIGKKAPGLTKVLTIGEGTSLKKLKEKVVMLDFWAPWCGPCRRAFPEMKELYKEFKDQGFIIVGATNYYPFYRDENENIQTISEKDYDKKLEEFKTRHELPWPFLVAKDKVNRNNYGVSFIPTFFLIDKKGIVRYAQVGTKEDPEFLKNKIKELL